MYEEGSNSGMITQLYNFTKTGCATECPLKIA